MTRTLLVATLLTLIPTAARADGSRARELIAEGVNAEKTGKWKQIKWASPRTALGTARRTGRPLLVFLWVPMAKANKDGAC